MIDVSIHEDGETVKLSDIFLKFMRHFRTVFYPTFLHILVESKNNVLNNIMFSKILIRFDLKKIAYVQPSKVYVLFIL